MKYIRCLTLVSTVILLLSLSAFARDRNEHRLSLTDPVQVGASQLAPGDYTLEWQETGPAVQVKFMQNGKTVATASGTLKTNDTEVTQDAVVTQTVSARIKILKEIDFKHQKEALVFG
jgi:hypothetical protein